ncbi:hypothetical protein AAX25_01668 [Aliarcobacter thereius]|nr:hypothetical protein AAX25_01668 [Aliarcobacter thereius]
MIEYLNSLDKDVLIIMILVELILSIVFITIIFNNYKD